MNKLGHLDDNLKARHSWQSPEKLSGRISRKFYGDALFKVADIVCGAGTGANWRNQCRFDTGNLGESEA